MQKKTGALHVVEKDLIQLQANRCIVKDVAEVSFYTEGHGIIWLPSFLMLNRLILPPFENQVKQTLSHESCISPQ